MHQAFACNATPTGLLPGRAAAESIGGPPSVGSSVWFPEGGIMEHGATDEADCVLLFMTNEPFGIDYPGKE